MSGENVSLQKWALIAEIVGGIAIIATLVLLVFEVRGNTNAVRAASYQNALELFISHNDLISTNPEAARLIQIGAFERNPESLTSVETFQLERLTSSVFQIYDIAFLAWEDGLMNESEWPRWQAGMCRVYSNYVAIDWDEFVLRQVSPRFANYLPGCPYQ